MEVLRRMPLSNSQTLVDVFSQIIPRYRPASRAAAQLPAVLMRTGTSKGLFIHRHHLPRSPSDWTPVLSAAMGSWHGDKRQLDGIGGASSTTSKAAIISPSAHPEADVDYTFAQVAVGQNKVDLRGSCGNVCSGVGAFALDEGLVTAKHRSDKAKVRVHDTNTGAIIEQHVKVDPDTGRFDPEGDHTIPGYSGSGSPVRLTWKKAAGTVKRGVLFPTGNRTDLISVTSPSGEAVTARASLVDATNPFVFIDAASLPVDITSRRPDDEAVLDTIEALRCQAAVLYGLAATPEEAHRTRAIPKIVLLHQPSLASIAEPEQPCVSVVPYTMGKPHPSFQLTGVLCLSVALSYPGTVADDIARRAAGLAAIDGADALDPEIGAVSKVISHPSGIAKAIVTHARGADGRLALDSVGVETTAQRLFKGEVDIGRKGLKLDGLL